MGNKKTNAVIKANNSELEKGLLGMLPLHIREGKELSKAAKLILGDIIYLHNNEYAKKNGCVFRSYNGLKKDTGIPSNGTLKPAIGKLLSMGYITREKGGEDEACVYYLNKDALKDNEMGGRKQEKTTKSTTNKSTTLSTTISTTFDSEAILLKLNELNGNMSSLLDRVERIENTISRETHESTSYIYTDTYTDTLNTILYNLLYKDNNINGIQLKYYINLFFNYFRKKLYNTQENNMLNELNTIENLFYNFIDKLQEKNIIPYGIESETKTESLNGTNERNNKSISVEENVNPSIQDTNEGIPMNGMKTGSLNGMVESSLLDNTTGLDKQEEDNKTDNPSTISTSLIVSDTMDKESSSKKSKKNNSISLTESTSLTIHDTSDCLSSGGNENDNPNVREVTSSMDETIVSDRQEDEKQSKIVHLIEEPHSHTDISEAHNPHCEKNIRLKGGGGAAVEKKNVPFAATKHPQSGETSENRSGAQENSQLSSYTTDVENVQNSHTYESERGSNDNPHTTDILQEDEKDEKDVISDEDLDPTKFIKVPTFEDFKEKYGDIDTIREKIREFAEENQDLDWYNKSYINIHVCKKAKMGIVFDV